MDKIGEYGYYLNGRYLGVAPTYVVEELSDAQVSRVAFDFLIDNFNARDLAEMGSRGMPEPRVLAMRALEDIWRCYKTPGLPKEYGGVSFSPTRPKQSKPGTKAPAKKTTGRRT